MDRKEWKKRGILILSILLFLFSFSACSDGKAGTSGAEEKVRTEKPKDSVKVEDQVTVSVEDGDEGAW